MKLSGCLLIAMASLAVVGHAADPLDPVSQQNAVVPRMSCDDKLDKSQALARGVVENRLRSGQIHAAYAEIMALPSQVAEVAILRADILRRLQRPEAREWFKALQKTCMGGLAEHGLGLLEADVGDYARAREHLLRAVKLAPTDARVRNDLGYVFLMLGQDAQSAFELRVASELAPEIRLPVLNLLLLALLRADSEALAEGMARWQPDAGERANLLRDCRRLHARRMGLPSGAQAACPLALPG